MLIKDYYHTRCIQDENFEGFFRDYIYCFCFGNMVIDSDLTHHNEVFFVMKICELLESYATGKANTIESFEKMRLLYDMGHLSEGLFSVIEKNNNPSSYIGDDCKLDLSLMIKDKLLYVCGDESLVSLKDVYKMNQWALYILRNFQDFSHIYNINR